MTMSVLMTSALFTFVRVSRRLACRLSLRALVKLRDLEILAPESVHHPDRAQTFLRLGEQRAFLFLDGGGFRPDAMGEEIDRADDERNDA